MKSMNMMVNNCIFALCYYVELFFQFRCNTESLQDRKFLDYWTLKGVMEIFCEIDLPCQIPLLENSTRFEKLKYTHLPLKIWHIRTQTWWYLINILVRNFAECIFWNTSKFAPIWKNISWHPKKYSVIHLMP